MADIDGTWIRGLKKSDNTLRKTPWPWRRYIVEGLVQSSALLETILVSRLLVT